MKSTVVQHMGKKRARVRKIKIEDIPLSAKGQELIDNLSKQLVRQVQREAFEEKYIPAREVLKLVGSGIFLAASVAVPNLPKALRPFLNQNSENDAWKRFNIPYFKRNLERLEKQKLVETKTEDNQQIVQITDRGRKRILKYALDKLVIQKPNFWDGKWRLVSYDIPRNSSSLRDCFRKYLSTWEFYPLHKSVFLHAYPCEKEIEFLREFLGIGKFVRIFTVLKIENDQEFKEFFGL